MAEAKQRIYKYDNVKAILIFLVVVGHLTTDYVTGNYSVRALTLWIYTFHMPAFIFVSGLMHKKYCSDEQAALGMKGNTKLRWDKVIGFILCAYGLKLFLQIFRTAIGQHPNFYWFQEPGIPWYLFVMAEYEIILYVIRKYNWKVMLISSFVLSAVIGYFPQVGDTLCLSRCINFLPLFLLGYYIDTAKLTEFCEKKWAKIVSWIVIAISLAVCFYDPNTLYKFRKWFTGRRSYEFLSDFFGNITAYAWAIRLGIWAIAIILTFAVIIVIPNRKMGYISQIGANTLNVYFWHRPICYWLNGIAVYPTLVQFCGGSEALGLVFFVLLGLAMTVLFGLNIFKHPAKDLTGLGVTITNIGKKKEA